jgi:hypothetical protein
LILSSLFGGKKKTAVSFATRSLSVAAVEERPAIFLLLFISPDFILLTHFCSSGEGRASPEEKARGDR